jgi:hypothetical protein
MPLRGAQVVTELVEVVVGGGEESLAGAANLRDNRVVPRRS